MKRNPLWRLLAMFVVIGWVLSPLRFTVAWANTEAPHLINGSGRFVDSGQRLGNSSTSEVALGDLKQESFENVTEVIDFDTYNNSQATIGKVRLENGGAYSMTISGTSSAWEANLWNKLCPASQQPEPQPVISSPGTINGNVGLDAEYVFAYPDAFGNCTNFPPAPFQSPRLQISLDNGNSWFSPSAVITSYNSSHVYSYNLVGKGFPPQIRQVDPHVIDNYGIFRFTIEGGLSNEPSTCETAFADELQSTVDTTNNLPAIASNETTTVFRDDFDGTTLNANTWQTYLNNGNVNANAGFVTLSRPGSGNTFPYVHTKQNPLPTTGNFAVKVGIQYLGVTGHGVGFSVDENTPANGISGGRTWEPTVYNIWQDSPEGFQLQDYTKADRYYKPANHLEYHDIEFRWLEDMDEYYVDGTLVNTVQRATNVPRPSTLWFGNPTIPSGLLAYTSFKLNYIEVATLPPSTPLTCNAGFSDEFTTLNPQWTWLDPRNDATKDTTTHPGFLRISAPTGNDLFPDPRSNYDAPRLLQPINGNFTIETLLEFAPTHSYQGAGLLVWQDDNNFLRLERGFGGVDAPQSNGIRFDKEENGSYTAVTPTSHRPTTASCVKLRMQRNGDRFTAWWRAPNQDWQYVGAADIPLREQVQVGLALIAQWEVPQTTADYDYFHLSCPKNLAPPVNLVAKGGFNSISLQWEPSAALGVTGYQVYRQADGEASFTRITIPAIPAITYRDTAVAASKTYTYYVTAVDASNQESDPSNTATAQVGTLNLVIPTVYAARQGNVAIPVNIENADGLCIGALDVSVLYNAQLGASQRANRTPLTDNYTFLHNLPSANEAHVSSISSNCQPLYGAGTLFALDFLVSPTTPLTTTALSFVHGLTNTAIYDQRNLQTPVSLNLTDGLLLLNPNGAYQRGDVNGDGLVNLADVNLALQIAAGSVAPTRLQQIAGDVNGDGVINAADGAMILYYVSKQVWPAALDALPLTAALNEAIQVKPSAVSGKPGALVDVPLVIDQAQSVAGGTLLVRYGAGLRFAEARLSNELLAKGFKLSTHANGNSETRLSLAGEQGLAAGAQTLVILRFQVNTEATESATQVAVIGVWLNDQAGRDFALSALQRQVMGSQGVVQLPRNVFLPLVNR